MYINIFIYINGAAWSDAPALIRLLSFRRAVIVGKTNTAAMATGVK